MTTLKDTDYGVGYGGNEFADTTASRAELERLARLTKVGGAPDSSYRYAKPTEDDEAPPRPCNYPPSLDDVLRDSLRQAVSWDQASAICEMKAAQISQTGLKGPKQRATAEEREWAHMIFAGSRAKQQLERIPGTCRGCNSSPCRCIA